MVKIDEVLIEEHLIEGLNLNEQEPKVDIKQMINLLKSLMKLGLVVNHLKRKREKNNGRLLGFRISNTYNNTRRLLDIFN